MINCIKLGTIITVELNVSYNVPPIERKLKSKSKPAINLGHVNVIITCRTVALHVVFSHVHYSNPSRAISVFHLHGSEHGDSVFLLSLIIKCDSIC